MINNDIVFTDYVSVKDFTDATGFDMEEEEVSELAVKFAINIAGNLVENYCSYPFLRQKVKDIKKGNGTSQLMLKYKPEQIIEVREVVSDNTKNVLPLSNMYINKELFCVQYSTDFFYPAYTYEITYTSGENHLPEKVKQAICLTALDYLNRKDYKNFQAIKIDVIQLNIKDLDVIPEEAKMLLKPWCSTGKVI
jgi:hypothetical protein